MPAKIRYCVVFCLLGLAAAAANAQAPVEEQKEQPDAASLRERDVYVPYDKLRDVFEKQGRGVFLPYEKFQELWDAARAAARPTVEHKPPVGALIAEIDNVATVEKDVVRVRAKLKIEVLAEGWSEVPLRLSDAGISSATLGGKPARLVGQPGADYKLLLEKKGKQPETMELDLEYAKAISRSPGRNSVSFQPPQAPVSRWRIVIPQSGVKVEVHPLVAATEAPAEKKPDGAEAAKPADETVLLALLGAAAEVRIDWTPKAEGAAGMEALASVEAEQQLFIAEGLLRSRTTLNYTISRAELAELAIDVPADWKIVNVFDANVRQWSAAEVEGERRITAKLFEPAKTVQQVVVELEKILDEKDEKAVKTAAAPLVKAVGIGRQQGLVVVQVAEGLKAEAAKSTGLMQIDAAELPPALRGGKWAFAWRYAAVPYELTFDLEKVRPRITADALVEARLSPDRMTLDMTVVYKIEKAGVFSLSLLVPDGFEVRHVGGAALPGVAPALVDNHTLEGGKEPRLAVNLSQKAIGQVGLRVKLEKELHAPELLTPGDKPAEIAFHVPMVHPAGVEQTVGRLVVYAPENLLVNPRRTEGLRSISFREAFETIPPAQQSDARPVLAFAYGREPAELELSAQRRKPQVIVRQLLVARIEEGVVKYDITFFYNVLHSGVKSLRLDLPAEAAKQIRVLTPTVREKPIEPPPADLAQGDVAWSLSGENEFLGEGKIEMRLEKKMQKLDVGGKVEIDLPVLKPRGVDRAWGQIAVVKAEAIDVVEAEEPRLLRSIDPQHDLLTPVPGAVRAYEFHDDWSLRLAATRYQLEDMKRLGIDLAVARMVVTRSNQTVVQVLYRVRGTRQRLAVRLPAKAVLDAQPLRIDGRSAALEEGGEDERFIPLPNADADTPAVVELRYTLDNVPRRLELPELTQQPAVQKAYLCVYLPENRRLLGAAGPWTEEFSWQFGKHFGWMPTPADDIGHLVALVCGPSEATLAAARDFPTDGRPYLFSTLRPTAGGEGALRLSTVDSRWLAAAVFIVAVVLGLLLLPAKTAERAFFIGLALVGLTLAGVFVPTFVAAVCDGVFLAALFVVLVLWSVAGLCHKRRCPLASAAPPGHVPGVDLTQFRPEPAHVDSPPAADAPKPDAREGGQTNE